MRPENKEGGIVLLREEFEGGRIFEGVEIVLFGKADGEGSFELVEIADEELSYLGTGGVAEKESGFGVFGGLRFAGFEGASGTGILRLAVVLLVQVRSQRVINDGHLLKRWLWVHDGQQWGLDMGKKFGAWMISKIEESIRWAILRGVIKKIRLDRGNI